MTALEGERLLTRVGIPHLHRGVISRGPDFLVRKSATQGFTALRRLRMLCECRGFSAVFARIYAADPGAESVEPDPKKSARSPLNPKMTFLTLCFTRE